MYCDEKRQCVFLYCRHVNCAGRIAAAMQNLMGILNKKDKHHELGLQLTEIIFFLAWELINFISCVSNQLFRGLLGQFFIIETLSVIKDMDHSAFHDYACKLK